MRLKRPFETWESDEGRVYVLDWQGTCIAKAVEVDSTKASATAIARHIAAALNAMERRRDYGAEIAAAMATTKRKRRTTKGAKRR